MAKSAFGSPVKRREDPRLLTGQAMYTDDFTLPGMVPHGGRAVAVRARPHQGDPHEKGGRDETASSASSRAKT